MIIHDCIQGSEKWCELRAGKPTSSEFDKIITPGGAPSKQASAYANRLICEIMLGRPLIGVMTPWMQRGKEMEAEAVKFYEFQKDVETVPVGFITTDDGRVGCSPDRLVGKNGLVEAKCPSDETQSKYLAVHIDALLGSGNSVGEDYKVQAQGQLWVAEKDFDDVIAYYPGLPSAITRIVRNEPFIATMRELVYRFLEMMDERLAKLKALGCLDVAVEPPAPIDFGAFGISEQDVEEYIEKLKAKGICAVVNAL